MPEKKIVFILGAGASKTIGLPLQSEFLSNIFSLKPRNIDFQSSFMKLDLNLKEQKILGLYEEFNVQRIKLADFIVNNFASYSLKAEYSAIKTKDSSEALQYTSEGMFRAFNIACKVSVTMEDLFTLFDKIIIGREHFRIYSPESIQEIHTALRKCIIFIIAYFNTIKIAETNPVIKFAKILIEYRKKVSVSMDNFSVITMNWDAYLEKTIFRLCEEYNRTQKRRKIYPDLCFYDYCYERNESRVVSTQVKAKGYRNIKILKLHGSINWLLCPYCGRLFVDYKQDVAIDEMLNECYCPLCYEEFEGNLTSPQMHSMLITPTFLKDLNNLNIKNIWHNALIDLTEASKVVFIGYSFPDADFEMRCLLKKALKPETKIDVVLHENDNPQYYKSILEDRPQVSEQIIAKLNLPEKRYISFFGKDIVEFNYCGMEKYLQNNFSEEVS